MPLTTISSGCDDLRKELADQLLVNGSVRREMVSEKRIDLRLREPHGTVFVVILHRLE
jgi:hypothetical protein